jgi:hypothetical protein
MLIQLVKNLGWHIPITPLSSANYRDAENEFLGPLLQDDYDDWATFFQDDEIAEIATELTKLFARDGSIAYVPPAPDTLADMIKQLVRGCPPVVAKVLDKNSVDLKKIRIASTLYAGWVYWAARDRFRHLPDFVELTFVEVNKLCDQALLQQRAIDLFLPAGGS